MWSCVSSALSAGQFLLSFKKFRCSPGDQEIFNPQISCISAFPTSPHFSVFDPGPGVHLLLQPSDYVLVIVGCFFKVVLGDFLDLKQ